MPCRAVPCRVGPCRAVPVHLGNGFYVQKKWFFALRWFFEKSILKLPGVVLFPHVTVEGAPLRSEGAFGASASLRSQLSLMGSYRFLWVLIYTSGLLSIFIGTYCQLWVFIDTYEHFLHLWVLIATNVYLSILIGSYRYLSKHSLNIVMPCIC